MENKRLSNKLNSLFWFVLTTLPLIVFLIYYIFALPQFAKNFDWSNNSFAQFFTNSFSSSVYQNIFLTFNSYAIPSLTTTFFRLFQTFNVANPQILTHLFAWMLSIQLYHLIYDVLKFIIGWCHNLIEKAY